MHNIIVHIYIIIQKQNQSVYNYILSPDLDDASESSSCPLSNSSEQWEQSIRPVFLFLDLYSHAYSA